MSICLVLARSYNWALTAIVYGYDYLVVVTPNAISKLRYIVYAGLIFLDVVCPLSMCS